MGGAAGPILFRHVAEYCDGWMPIGGAGMSEALEQLRAACDEVGRDFGALHLAPFGVFPAAGKMDYYQSLGLAECALRIPSAAKDRVLPALDAYVEWIDRMA